MDLQTDFKDDFEEKKNFSIGTSRPKNQEYFFSDVPLLPGIFRWNAPKVQPDFVEDFCKWSMPLLPIFMKRPPL